MIFIDSNIILSYINYEDSKHNEALHLVSRIMKKEFGDYIISDYVFSEIVTVCEIKINKKESVKIGNFLLENIYISKVLDKIFSDSWDIFKRNKKLSFTDCTNLAIMKGFGINKIATFDKEFNKIKDIEVIN